MVNPCRKCGKQPSVKEFYGQGVSFMYLVCECGNESAKVDIMDWTFTAVQTWNIENQVLKVEL